MSRIEQTPYHSGAVFPNLKHSGQTQEKGKSFVPHISMYLQSWHGKSLKQKTQVCVKHTFSSFRISVRVSWSFSTLLQLATWNMPLVRSYSSPSLIKRTNFSFSMRGSRNAFLFKITVSFKPLEPVHIHEEIHFFRLQLKPRNQRRSHTRLV